MKEIRVSQDVVPLGQFKAHASRYLKQLDGPVIITQNGRPAGVLVSPGEYDRMRERERFLESIAAGLSDSEAGRVMDTGELRNRLAEFRDRKSPR